MAGVSAVRSWFGLIAAANVSFGAQFLPYAALIELLLPDSDHSRLAKQPEPISPTRGNAAAVALR